MRISSLRKLAERLDDLADSAWGSPDPQDVVDALQDAADAIDSYIRLLEVRDA